MGWGDLKDELNESIYKGFRIIPSRICFNSDGARERWTISATIQRVGGNESGTVVSDKGAFIQIRVGPPQRLDAEL